MIFTEGEHGYLVPVDDYLALADKLQEMAIQPPVRAAMGQAARELAGERFDFTRACSHQNEVYAGAGDQYRLSQITH